MWLMLQQPEPDDFVIATGETHPLERFVEAAFADLGLDWRAHVETDPTLLRPTDIVVGRANPRKAAERLGWTARHTMRQVVALMVGAERSRSQPGARELSSSTP
jgi:GDPmannose 4,6-dehydratase